MAVEFWSLNADEALNEAADRMCLRKLSVALASSETLTNIDQERELRYGENDRMLTEGACDVVNCFRKSVSSPVNRMLFSCFCVPSTRA